MIPSDAHVRKNLFDNCGRNVTAVARRRKIKEMQKVLLRILGQLRPWAELENELVTTKHKIEEETNKIMIVKQKQVTRQQRCDQEREM